MTNRKIAQERLNEEIEERRIELIEIQLAKISELEEQIKKANKEIEELETRVLTPKSTDGFTITASGNCITNSFYKIK